MSTVDCSWRKDGKKFNLEKRRYEVPGPNELSAKERRAFQRLVSGLTIGDHKGAYMRFMTLTTRKGVEEDMNKSFNLLKMWILRATMEKDGFDGFKFNKYFKLKTAEMYGVMHIVYWGLYIPQEWLSRAWAEIHGSPIVDIRRVWVGRRGVRGLVGYLLTNYLTKQPIIRMSYGWKWVWLGMVKSWKHIIEVYGWKHTLRVWSFLMKEPLPTSRQCKLKKFL